jgi:hypothetical protein
MGMEGTGFVRWRSLEDLFRARRLPCVLTVGTTEMGRDWVCLRATLASGPRIPWNSKLPDPNRPRFETR